MPDHYSQQNIFDAGLLMQKMKIKLGSRPSKLAVAQAELAKTALLSQNSNLDVEIVLISTRGDSHQELQLGKPGGRGVFTDGVESALRQGAVDLAVHSAKDMSCRDSEDLAVVGTLESACDQDAWISRDGVWLMDAPSGFRVGTSSVRRGHQLRRIRPDLQVISIRGNVDTRLQKMMDGEVDGLILAAAGLNRLGLTDKYEIRLLDSGVFVPAPCQGIIALQARREDKQSIALAKQINHLETWLRLNVERSCVASYGADCSDPLAVHCTFIDETRIKISGVYYGSDYQIAEEIRGCKDDDLVAMGTQLGSRLKQRVNEKVGS